MWQSFPRPENYLNRELSWPDFNERVLEEAEDPAVPLLERVKFLATVANNLDQFLWSGWRGSVARSTPGSPSRGPTGAPPGAPGDVV